MRKAQLCRARLASSSAGMPKGLFPPVLKAAEKGGSFSEAGTESLSGRQIAGTTDFLYLGFWWGHSTSSPNL